MILLLVIPLYNKLKTPHRLFLSGLRLSLLILAVICLAAPYLDLTGKGIDLVVLRDRSASIGAGGSDDCDEVLRLLGSTGARGADDRIGLIGFSKDAALEIPPGPAPVFSSLPRQTSGQGSNIAESLKLAALLRSPLRRTRFLILSDGLYTGRDPFSPSVLSRLRGIPVWYRYVGRPRAGDTAAGAIVLPSEVSPDAGFILRFSIFGGSDGAARYTLKRGDTVIASESVQVRRGVNHFFARDIVSEGGMHEYRLDVSAPNDAVAENNVSSALLRVTASPAVLLVSGSGRQGFLYSLLTRANIPVENADAATVDWSAARLAPYKVVILENLPMKALGYTNARALAEVVESGLVSLIVTGGQHSFGNGGYYKSPLDALLPVTMELRDQQRKGTMALVAVLDRSGSMSMTVSGGAGGMTKMDLANIGVAEAIKLLSPLDQVSVIAVDSQAHLIVPLSQADDTSRLVDTVLSIQSMGGGIFVRTAMDAAAREIRKSNLPNRHIILFSDARDSEEQKDTVAFTRKLQEDGIGVSVIGLGAPNDRDAQFLRDVAAAGNGDIYFTLHPEDLPRVFSQEVIRVSRRGFVKDPTEAKTLPDILRLQLPVDLEVPVLGGYNLVSLKKGASCALVTTDDYKSPLVSFWRKGRASVAAVTLEIDGPFSGEFPRWSNAPELLLNLVRLVAGNIQTASVKAYSRTSRGAAAVRIEFGEEMADRLRGRVKEITFLPPAGGDTLSVPLKWESPSVAGVELELPAKGHYLPVLDLGEEGVLRAPVVSMDYSPEFLPVEQLDGEEVLEELASATRGKAMVKVDELFSPEGLEAQRSRRDMRLWLILIILLLLLLLEIAERRLSFSEFFPVLVEKFKKKEKTVHEADEDAHE